VLGWAQIVQAASPRDPTIVRALASIKRNAEAQQRLVEDLLDVSRIVTGKFPLDRHPFDLQTAVAAAVDAIRPSAAAKNIQLDVAIDSAAQIEGDPDRIQQVAANLLSNAVKFTPQGGHISVMLAPANGRARLTVCDTGEGIAPDLKPHIFDRFRQGDGSSTRAHGGLGLGLAIAKHIVDAHGGSIVASSDGPGKGSTFSVELPVP
jgi:signal transduction histidine kinase